MRIKRALVFLLLCVALVALTGCFNVKQHLTINADGSADIENTITMDSSLLEAASAESGGEDLSTIFDDLSTEAEAEGFKVEGVDEGGQTGIKATKHVEDVEKLDLSELGEGTQGEVSVEKGFLQNTYTVDITLPFEAEGGGGEELGADAVEAEFALTMPGKIGETNGTLSDDGRTATWDLKISEENKIQASAVGYNTPVVAGLGGVALLLIAIAVIVAVLLMRRGRSAEPGAPMGYQPPAGPQAGPPPMEPAMPPAEPAPAMPPAEPEPPQGEEQT